MLALILELEQKRAVLQSLTRLVRERLENENTTDIQWWDTRSVECQEKGRKKEREMIF